MVGVEDGLRAREIDHLVGALRPRQRDQPVDVGPRHGVLGGGHRHLGQAVQLADRLLLHRLRHPGGVDLLAQLLDFLRLVVALAELPLDGLELLAQEVVALVLADLRLHLRLDLGPELEDLELLDEDAVQGGHALAKVERLEHLLLERRRDRAQARRDEVGEPAGLGDVEGERLQVVREQRRKRHDLLEVRLDVPLHRVDLEAVVVGRGLGRAADAPAQVGLGRDDLVDVHARQPLHDQPQAAVGQLEHLVDVRGGADGVEVLLARLLHRRVALREDGDQLAGADRLVDQAHRALARHGERHERIREEHRVAERQDRQLRRDHERLLNPAHVVQRGLLWCVAHRQPSARRTEGGWPLDCHGRKRNGPPAATGRRPA